MTRILEKMSLLGLSLLLISAFSISTALPPMLDYYSPTFSAAQVELLVSVPSFSVVAMLLLNSFIDKWLSDRQLIVTGLLLLSSAGIFPFFVQLIFHVICTILNQIGYSSVYWMQPGYGITEWWIPVLYLMAGVIVTLLVFMKKGENEDVF